MPGPPFVSISEAGKRTRQEKRAPHGPETESECARSKLGSVHPTIRSPQAYLARIATNLWIDTVRRRGSEARILEGEAAEPRADTTGPDRTLAVRDAGQALLQHAAGRLPKVASVVSCGESLELSG